MKEFDKPAEGCFCPECLARAEVHRLRGALEDLHGGIALFCEGGNRCICGSIKKWAAKILNRTPDDGRESYE